MKTNYKKTSPIGGSSKENPGKENDVYKERYRSMNGHEVIGK